jgi:hypothetical protein
MNDKPEALRLADALQQQAVWESHYGPSYLRDLLPEAAAELRRLHAVNGELLEALKEIEPILARMYGPQAANLPPMQRVRAAIAKAEGEQK